MPTASQVRGEADPGGIRRRKSAAAQPGATEGQTRWMQIPLGNRGVVVEPNGTKTVLEDEVGTAEAARMLGRAQRTVQALCDEGVLREGTDWRKLPSRGLRPKLYRITRRSVLRLRDAIGGPKRIATKREGAINAPRA